MKKIETKHRHCRFCGREQVKRISDDIIIIDEITLTLSACGHKLTNWREFVAGVELERKLIDRYKVDGLRINEPHIWFRYGSWSVVDSRAMMHIHKKLIKSKTNKDWDPGELMNYWEAAYFKEGEETIILRADTWPELEKQIKDQNL